ncbi:MAG: ribosomal protein S2 [bacterium]
MPGNDDAARALKLYARFVSDAVLDGIAAQVKSAPAVARPAKGGQRKTVVKLSPKATAASKEEPKTDAKAETKVETKEAKPAVTTAKATKAETKTATAN